MYNIASKWKNFALLMLFLLLRLLYAAAKGLIESHHLGFQASGVEGFADGGVEGRTVEDGLEGGGYGVKVFLRADFAGGDCVGEDFLPEGDFVLHDGVVAFAQVRVIAFDLQDEEKVGVGGILGQGAGDGIQVVGPGADDASEVGLDEVLEGHAIRVVHLAVDVLLFQHLADNDLAEEIQLVFGIIEDSAAGKTRGVLYFFQRKVADVVGKQQ